MRYTVVVDNDVTRWFKEDTEVLHRENGPAVVYKDGTECWYLNGVWMTEERFKCLTGPAVEMTVEEISQRLGMNVKVVKG